MKLIVNGRERQLDNVRTVEDLLKQLGHEARFVAVAVNRACVPRSIYGETPLNAEDEIEILAPMQGG
jgi:sulfur carrier protein